jgi:hypothetical protein
VATRENWRVVSVSSEEPRSNNLAAYVFDGAVNSAWHTAWVLSEAEPPHELVLDMGFSMVLKCVSFIERQDNPVGRVKAFDFYVSNDRSSWGAPVLSGELASTGGEQRFEFAPKSAQYLRLVVRSAENGERVAALAEINVFSSVGRSGPVAMRLLDPAPTMSPPMLREYLTRYGLGQRAYLPIARR